MRVASISGNRAKFQNLFWIVLIGGGSSFPGVAFSGGSFSNGDARISMFAMVSDAVFFAPQCGRDRGIEGAGSGEGG